jgi:hypothetical protein
MKQMALHQESAYERLCQWFQSKITSVLFCLYLNFIIKVNVDFLIIKSSEISTLVSEALGRLKARQVFI